MRWGAFDSTDRERGFTLIEVLAALVVLSIMALGVAALFGVAIRAVHAARSQTSTAALATEKMEQIRSLTWGFDLVETSLPVSDTTTNLSQTPATNTGTGLNPSPAGTLNANTPGFVDYLDGRGQWVGTGAAPPPTAIYIRRWSIEPLPTNPNNTLVLQVLVTTVVRENAVNAAGAGGQQRRRYPDDALIATVKTRKGR
jgi:prepilin-type N-terminal cleavage/methylation domain-containing protein